MRLLAALLALIVIPAPVVAEPAQLGRPGPQKKAPAGPKNPDALPDGEIRVRAGNQEQISKGHYKFRDFVDIRLGDMRIQADRADVDEIEKTDGTMGHKVVAESNVVFLRGEERLSGERLEIDDSGKGTFFDALGFVEPGVFVEGKRIDRLDDKTYRVEGGKFTSCAQPNPRWGFSASSAKIQLNDKVIAKNAVLKVKSVPIFYLPVIYYPIRDDQRSTGFLIPHAGNSSTKGFDIGTGFFWAMGRSFDQTLYADHYSRIGWGFGHELRYLQDAPSRGVFKTYVFRTKDTGLWDWDLDWNALQVLPGKVKATLNVRQYSDLLFQQRFQDSFNFATTRTKRSAFSLQRSFGSDVLQVSADQTDTYFGDDTRVQGHLPSASLRHFPKQIGKTGIVVGYEARADDLKNGFADQSDTYWRFDLAPEVSRPLSLSFITVTPQLRYRYTHYQTSYTIDADGQSALLGNPLDRSFVEGGLDLRGPNFSRVFSAPGGGYSERFKHVIGPEISWTYRTRVENFNLIPKFDGVDYFLGTNEINYGIVQRFLAKRPAASGRSVPYEFLSWRVSQTYYVQISDGQSNFDPNYSSSAFGPGFKPEHLSPLLSRFRLRPVPGFSVDQTLEYDVNFQQIRRSSVNANLGGSRFNVTGGWSRSVRLSDKEEERTVVANAVRGAAGLQIVPGKLRVDGSADYDFVNKLFWHMNGRLRYDVQCCGFMVEAIRYNYNGRDERQFRFSIELANVGSIGSFLGGDQGGLGGYR